MTYRLSPCIFAAATLAGVCCSQTWSPLGSGPAAQLGLNGDLLGADAQGLVGFDEAAAQTLVPTQPFTGTLTVLATGASPPARLQSTLASDGADVLLFGGIGLVSGQLRNDLWRFDRASGGWVAMTAWPNQPPAPRRNAGAAAWSAGGRYVMFGGEDTTGLRTDTWTLTIFSTAAIWSSVPTPQGLVGRTRHAMARAFGDTAVLFGGDDGAPLGDTWIFDGSTWARHQGPGPSPAASCRMAFDPFREITVLVHPNGETWEWNGFAWRLVGALATPPWSLPAAAFDRATGLETLTLRQSNGVTVAHRFLPSPAAFAYTLDLVCVTGTQSPPHIAPVERSLPVLGATMHLRIHNTLPTGLAFGALAFPSPFQLMFGCQCSVALSPTGAATQLLPNVTTGADWQLPIANVPLLYGAQIDLQGFVFDASSPCLLLTTERGSIVMGR